MMPGSNNRLFRNSIFAWIALATGLVLLIPLAAMQFTPAVNWTRGDFVVMGCLLFGTGSLYVLVARKLPRQRRLIVGAMFGLALLYVWAELATGILTDLGS